MQAAAPPYTLLICTTWVLKIYMYICQCMVRGWVGGMNVLYKRGYNGVTQSAQTPTKGADMPLGFWVRGRGGVQMRD